MPKKTFVQLLIFTVLSTESLSRVVCNLFSIVILLFWNGRTKTVLIEGNKQFIRAENLFDNMSPPLPIGSNPHMLIRLRNFMANNTKAYMRIANINEKSGKKEFGIVFFSLVFVAFFVPKHNINHLFELSPFILVCAAHH